jgi:hypothetical protein
LKRLSKFHVDRCRDAKIIDRVACEAGQQLEG